MKKKTFILLSAILLIGGILRFWQLGKVPVSPDWDEVSLGYNAYSLMQTGRDEYGKFLPIVMRSFDDYKPALYSYLAIPVVAVFGMNVFAVRFVSALFGTLTVIAVYFLLRELFGQKNLKLEARGFTIDIPILATFLLAISPWHIQFSRIAFESNVGLSFNVFSMLFFLKGLKKPWFFILSAVFAGLSIYVYQSEKVFVPLVILTLITIYRKEILAKPKKYILGAAVLGALIVAPMFFHILTDRSSLQRAKGVSVFSDSTQLLSESTKRVLVDVENHDVLGMVLDNRRILFAKEVVSGYLSHFDLNWLFTRGDISRHHAPSMGLLYIFELPLLLIGIYMLLFGPFSKKTKIFIFAWFLLTPVPASITSGVPHAVRTLNFLPTFQIFTAIGIITSLSFVSGIRYQVSGIRIAKLFAICYLLLAVFNFTYYLNQYFVQQNYFNAGEWQYGYEKVIPEVKKVEGNYRKIVVSNEAPMDQSYMFFLFYLKYPPDLYQKQSVNASGGFRENHTFGKFEFRPINWEQDQQERDILFVGREIDFPKSISYDSVVHYPDGKAAMKIVSP
ncbi:MAG: glycosyltransferase family 39 protein [Candidatus Levyibacteriota bacterium]